MTRFERHQFLDRIVSGGQTGVDRGALNAAIALGIPHGGWCPQGRLAEDGAVPDQYHLRETRSARYSVRTRKNVVDSSGTLILCQGALQGGTLLTRRLAQRYEKPCFVVDLLLDVNADKVRCWISEHGVRILNVAGPRESSFPGIARRAQQFLQEVLAGPGTSR